MSHILPKMMCLTTRVMKMMTKHPTRYYSDRQEKQVVKLLGGRQTANSGAGKWSKGDVIIDDASLLCECKTPTTDKESFSIKKEWLEKNLKETKESHLLNHCLAFNFGPDQNNYFIIDEKLMRFLVEKIKESG